jgi:hypothetical protein
MHVYKQGTYQDPLQSRRFISLQLTNTLERILEAFSPRLLSLPPRVLSSKMDTLNTFQPDAQPQTSLLAHEGHLQVLRKGLEDISAWNIHDLKKKETVKDTVSPKTRIKQLQGHLKDISDYCGRHQYNYARAFLSLFLSAWDNFEKKLELQPFFEEFEAIKAKVDASLIALQELCQAPLRTRRRSRSPIALAPKSSLEVSVPAPATEIGAAGTAASLTTSYPHRPWTTPTSLTMKKKRGFQEGDIGGDGKRARPKARPERSRADPVPSLGCSLTNDGWTPSFHQDVRSLRTPATPAGTGSEGGDTESGAEHPRIMAEPGWFKVHPMSSPGGNVDSDGWTGSWDPDVRSRTTLASRSQRPVALSRMNTTRVPSQIAECRWDTYWKESHPRLHRFDDSPAYAFAIDSGESKCNA